MAAICRAIGDEVCRRAIERSHFVHRSVATSAGSTTLHRVNDALAHQRLQEILVVIDDWGQLYERRWGYGHGGHEAPGLDETVRVQIDTVRARAKLARDIVSAMGEPNLSKQIEYHEEGLYGGHPLTKARVAIVEAIAIIAQREELAEIVGPIGPRLSATRLHPAIWGAAAVLWDGEHYRAGVQTAASALEALLQNVAGAGVSGASLAEVFSLKEGSKTPRLRLRGYVPESRTWRSAHDGAAALVRAAFQSVRNTVSHPGAPELDPDQALEMLAILSYATRLVDASDTVAADG